MDTTASHHYRALRADLTALAAGLGPAELATPVPALPGWTVHDTLSHLAGVCADVLDGHVGQAQEPAATAAQVAARAAVPTEDVLAEWNDRAPRLEAFMDDPAGRAAIFCVFDVFHHLHDIRGALRLAGGRTGEHAEFIAATMTKLHRKPWAAAGRPPIRLSTDTGSWQLGEGEPVAALHTSDFELSRILIGRRSTAQMLAAGWSGDPAPVVGFMPAFGPPAEDLIE